MKLFLVAGARPNFMKIAPLLREIKKYPEIDPVIVHTGQHYDYEMSAVFFSDLEIPEPDVYLSVGSGSHGEQTGKIMIAIEKEVIRQKPNLIVVVGDVNSTLAASVVASKLQIPVAHIEAGLRSFDRTMPEEINRQVTDVLSDYLFTTEESGNLNLKKEGIEEDKIHFVGDIMIEALINAKCKMQNAKCNLRVFKSSNLHIFKSLHLQSPHALLTLHRPSNVDNRETLAGILDALTEISKRIRIIFPIHPRTRKMITEFGFEEKLNTMEIVHPLGYLEFLALEKNATLVLTDSGGMQAETTYFGVPCLTIRKNTERPVTLTMGTNKLVGTDKDRIIEESFKILDGDVKNGSIPPLWDGRTAERIVKVLLKSS